MSDRDLQIGQVITKDQAKRLTLKVLAFLPCLFMFLAGVSMAHVRYEESGKLTAFGWIILGAIIGAILTGVVLWQVG